MPKCKECGREATEEQVFDAASKVQDLDSLMKGAMLWQCTLCRAKESALRHAINDEIRAELIKLRGAVSTNSLQLLTTEALIAELFKRYPHVLVAFRTLPIEGVNESTEGQFIHGDYRMCQGLALGIANRCERDIVASADRRRSSEETEEL